MSTFGTPTGPGRTLRERSFDLRTLPSRVEESLLAPDLETPVPVLSEGAKMAADLARAIGVSGDIVQKLAEDEYQRSERARIAADRSRALREREDARLKAVDEGLANEHFDGWAPGVLAQIANRDILPAGDDASIQKQVEDRIKLETEGHSPAYAEKFRERAIGFLTQNLTKSREMLRDEATEGLLGHGSSGLLEPTIDNGDRRQLLGSMKNLALGMSDHDFQAKTVLPALKRAADTGDVKMATELSELLTDDFHVEKATALANAAQESQQRQNRQFAAAKGEVDAAVDRASIGSGTYRQAYDLIDAQLKSGRITPDFADQRRADVKAKQDQALKESETVGIRASLAAWKDSVLARADDLFGVGHAFALNDEKVEKTDRSGVVHSESVSQDEQKRYGFSKGVQRIVARKLSPAETQDEIIKLATRADYPPPYYKQLLSSGYTAATNASLTGDGKDAPIPDATQGGFALYRELSAKSPTLLAKLVDQPTADFYETAMIVQEDSTIGVGTPDADRQALTVARRIVKDRGFIDDATSKELLKAAGQMGVFWGPNANYKNNTEIAGMIARKARLYVRSGRSAADAVALAAEKLKPSLSDINGWAVRTDQAQIAEEFRPKFPKALEGFVKAWSDKYADDDGLAFDDLSVRYDVASDSWAIINQITGFEVSAHGEPGLAAFTTNEVLGTMRTVAENMEKAERDAAKESVLNPKKSPSVGELIAPAQRPGEPFADYTRRTGRRRPGEF